MTDWGIIARIWAGYGVNIIVLIILLLIVWIVGLVVQRLLAKSKIDSKKG
jgi:Na+-transporting methylmalonyl-CoA/oxaloacetate decarboxylase gamma subunit